jgi:Trypsin-like peptidase domain/PEGA domain
LRSSEGTGSGFVLTETGVAVTNAHVARGQKILTASTPNGQTFNATVEFVDPRLDLALLKVQGSNFSHLVIGDFSKVEPGMTVIAIGTPSNGFRNTVTKGIVSGLGAMSNEPGTWVQTDTAINPGNSGGPLLNASGEVIGITTQKEFFSSDHRPLQGIGFALSSSDLLSILDRFYPGVTGKSGELQRSSNGSGSIKILSNVDGSEIYIDNKFVGNSPSTLVVSAGSHKIRVEAGDHAAWEKELELSDGSQISVTANLGSPSQSTRQSPALSTSNVQPVNPTAGNSLLADKSPNASSVQAKGMVAPSENAGSNWKTIVTKSLAAHSKITITSTPPNAQLFIDSAGKGSTPLSFEIAPGNHAIQIVLQGYKDATQKLSVLQGNDLSVDVSLQK